MNGPKCKDCGTPLLYECTGCSATNYPQQAGEVQGDALEALRREYRPTMGDGILRAWAADVVAALAARQTVGQEPVAWMRRHVTYAAVDGRAAGERIVSENKVYEDDVPLYAATPAQTVDLEQFRSLARSWIVEAGGSSAETKHACADELLAVIDGSNAVDLGQFREYYLARIEYDAAYLARSQRWSDAVCGYMNPDNVLETERRPEVEEENKRLSTASQGAMKRFDEAEKRLKAAEQGCLALIDGSKEEA